MNPDDNKQQNPARPVMDVAPPRPQVSNQPAPQQVDMSPADAVANSSNSDITVQNQVARPKKNRKKLALVLLIIFVSIIFAAGLAWFFLSQETKAPVVTPTEPTTGSARVSTEEIGETLSEIDKTLNTLNDSADFTPSDVNNSALGL